MKKSMSSLNVKKKISVKTILFGCVLSFLCPLIGNVTSATLPEGQDKITSTAKNLYLSPLNQKQNEKFENLDPTYKESCIKLNAEILSEKFASVNKWNSASKNEKGLIRPKVLRTFNESNKKFKAGIKSLQARAMEKYYDDDCDKENNFNNIEVEYPVNNNTIAPLFPEDPELIKHFAEIDYNRNSSKHKRYENLDPKYKENAISAKTKQLAAQYYIMNRDSQGFGFDKHSDDIANKTYEDTINELQERARNCIECNYDCDREGNWDRVQVEYPVKKSTRLLI